jgi:AraC-like DNA-binding protein
MYRQFLPKPEDHHAKPDQDQLRIRKMLAFIHDHFAENILLSDIAASVNIGERECLRCFQRVIQVSPMQYLLKYRVMQGASLLLRSGSDSITNIARYCGFENPSYFTLMFKRYFKITPREYRKKERGNV